VVEGLLAGRDVSLCDLEGIGIFKKNPVNLAHLPTLMLAVGYPIFWVELYIHDAKYGITSPLAAGLFLCLMIFVIIRERQTISDQLGQWVSGFLRLDVMTRTGCLLVLAFVAVMVACSFYAALFPPHLMQESDAMNYHYSLPRQHLILGSFARIPWSGFDVFFLPVDFALAPFWFVTALPNKFPQFIFLIGLIAVTASLSRFLKKDWISVVFVVALVFGSHGHGIQMGSAMLDLVNAYLCLAAIDSFFRRAHWLFIIEANFYLWSKSFIPVQLTATFFGMVVLLFILQKIGCKEVFLDFKNVWTSERRQEDKRFIQQTVLGFLGFAILVAGPFVVKSLMYTGTPLYPFAIGTFAHPSAPNGSADWTFVKYFTEQVVYKVYDNYGAGRSWFDFIRHFWLVAVPLKGVNNAYDYPLGLSYLLVLGPFILFTYEAFSRRRVPLLPLVVIVMWGLWWFGSQQSRWLYAPLTLMFILTAVQLKPSKLFWTVLIAALMSNSASMIRAHKSDWTKDRLSVLRSQDRALVDMSRVYIHDGGREAVQTQDYEVAFAQFPVVVRKENLPNAVAF
jgi:hypothetical protein